MKLSCATEATCYVSVLTVITDHHEVQLSLNYDFFSKTSSIDFICLGLPRQCGSDALLY